jgi:hypothetical protein
MPAREPVEARFARIEAAFRKDGFEVARFPDPRSPGRTVGYRLKDDRLGICAHHTRARNSRTGDPKRAFYVEGDGLQMGWLLGAMAEPEVARMAGDFVENVAFAFFGSGPMAKEETLPRVKDLIVRIIASASERMLPDIPPPLLAEIDGIVQGCRAVNPATSVQRDRLLALNLGIDCLLAHIYTGTIFAERGVHPSLLRTPIGCNAFALSGDAASGRHFFGRDFMFPTADVFQDTACVFILVPDGPSGVPGGAFVSQGAPGLVGTMAAMNTAGLAVGVDMLPSRLCDPRRPGLNSLLLIRDCVQHCPSVGSAVDRIREAPRGVSWLYPVADAEGQACVVEAGCRLDPQEPFPYFEHVPAYYRVLLPGLPYIQSMRAKYGTPEPCKGLIVRGRDYPYPEKYVRDWNKGLWKAFDRNWLTILKDVLGRIFGGKKGIPRWKDEIRTLLIGTSYSEAMFEETGVINTTWKGRNCPGPFYFAPQREQRPDVLIATNHCITPEMRFTSMNEWIALLSSGDQNDIQWRYDEMNREILAALEASPAGIDEAAAWDLIDFLRPDGRFPDYYNPGGKQDWRQVQVHGSVTLCELTSRTFTSLFGYYGDQPVTIHLRNYSASGRGSADFL